MIINSCRLSFNDAKYHLQQFIAIDLNKDGNIDIEELAFYLQLDVSFLLPVFSLLDWV